MRVIESAGFYYPTSAGGTEVYVSSLSRNLQADGIECIVAAPAREASHYFHEGVEVFRYPVPERLLRNEVQGNKAPRQFDKFEGWLSDQRADVYHQHSWTTGCGLWHLKTAKRLGLKTVITVHVPGSICMRGTMLYEGSTGCDGKIEPERCASCWLQSKGMPVGIARRMAKLPAGLRTLARVPRIGPVLAANALAARRKIELHEMAASADRIVAPCSWLYAALLGNGLPQRKLVLNRQGVGHQLHGGVASRTRNDSEVFRFGFLGRWDPIKGMHVVVEAFKRLPKDLPVELVVCAVGERYATEKYHDEVRRSASIDRRIKFIQAIPQRRVGTFLAGIDALVVPSQWQETGPIVVLEAFAAGTPVIGSNLGGISELVNHGRDGLLVPYDDIDAWTAGMLQLATNRALLANLRVGMSPVRTMSDVAADMARLYLELIV
jgi:glycosyltransferase involved in cell wall biosynthesis